MAQDPERRTGRYFEAKPDGWQDERGTDKKESGRTREGGAAARRKPNDCTNIQYIDLHGKRLRPQTMGSLVRAKTCTKKSYKATPASVSR